MYQLYGFRRRMSVVRCCPASRIKWTTNRKHNINSAQETNSCVLLEVRQRALTGTTVILSVDVKIVSLIQRYVDSWLEYIQRLMFKHKCHVNKEDISSNLSNSSKFETNVVVFFILFNPKTRESPQAAQPVLGK